MVLWVTATRFDGLYFGGPESKEMNVTIEKRDKLFPRRSIQVTVEFSRSEYALQLVQCFRAGAKIVHCQSDEQRLMGHRADT